MVSSKILIVEDGNLVALHLKNKLEKHGYVVAGIASSGKKAIEMVEETSPDLVLMDIMLKGDMDGVSAAEYIFNLFDVPVVFLTAYYDQEIIERAKLTEPFGYIIKPFEERELITNIEIALYRHRMEKDLKVRQKWFSSLVNCIEDAVLATDRNGDMVVINPSAQSLTG